MRRSLTTIVLFLSSTLLFGQSVGQHPDWPGTGQLFVGTCYQPVDRSPEQIRQDIALMKQAGFTMVRMGDLSWDAFEPSEGQFEFAWFDNSCGGGRRCGLSEWSRNRRQSLVSYLTASTRSQLFQHRRQVVPLPRKGFVVQFQRSFK